MRSTNARSHLRRDGQNAPFMILGLPSEQDGVFFLADHTDPILLEVHVRPCQMDNLVGTKTGRIGNREHRPPP